MYPARREERRWEVEIEGRGRRRPDLLVAAACCCCLAIAYWLGIAYDIDRYIILYICYMIMQHDMIY